MSEYERLKGVGFAANFLLVWLVVLILDVSFWPTFGATVLLNVFVFGPLVSKGQKK